MSYYFVYEGVAVNAVTYTLCKIVAGCYTVFSYINIQCNCLVRIFWDIYTMTPSKLF